MSNYTKRVPIPAASSINSGLSPCGNSLLNHFGRPGPLKTDCSPPTNGKLKAKLVTKSVGPFRVTGLIPAVDSLTRIFAKIKTDDPELYNELKAAGMLCCRLIRGSKTSFSIHSWGAAIDLYCGAGVVPLGTPQTHAGLLKAYPYFHNEGWYWGAEFSRPDGMHFEVSSQKIAEWIAKGLI